MLYSKIVAVPVNTFKASPYHSSLKITKGIITNISIFFPWGCAGLCGVQILHNTWQILPLSRTEWIIGNDLIYEFGYKYEVTQSPDILTVKCYNDDDSFIHHPIVLVEMSDNYMSENLRQLLNVLGT